MRNDFIEYTYVAIIKIMDKQSLFFLNQFYKVKSKIYIFFKGFCYSELQLQIFHINVFDTVTVTVYLQSLFANMSITKFLQWVLKITSTSTGQQKGLSKHLQNSFLENLWSAAVEERMGKQEPHHNFSFLVENPVKSWMHIYRKLFIQAFCGDSILNYRCDTMHSTRNVNLLFSEWSVNI